MIVPALIFAVVFFLQSAERSSILIFSINGENAIDDLQQRAGVEVAVVKIRRILLKFRLEDVKSVQLTPARFSVGDGLIVGFNVLVGLGLLYYSRELFDISAWTQGLPFFAYGIFCTISAFVYAIFQSSRFEINFPNDRKIIFKLYLFSKRLTEKLFGSIFDEKIDAIKLRGRVKVDFQGLLNICLLVLLFLIMYFTFSFTCQLLDSITFVLLLMAFRRVLNHVIRPSVIFEKSSPPNTGRFQLLTNKNPIKLGKILFPAAMNGKEWFLWIYLSYETGWKSLYNFTLLCINPTLFTWDLLLIFVGYCFVILLTTRRIDQLSLKAKQLHLKRWIIIGLFITPITSIFSALGILPVNLTILGVKLY
ncbi:MAG: hypothetical protein ACTSWN_07835 [Promethearchaeota archaeon]